MNTKATSIEMANAIKEYAQDPNCWASLWVQDEYFDNWTKEEKAAFILACMPIKAAHDKLNNYPVS